MQLRYGFISDERCKEINSWKIRDPYGYGEFYTAEREDFVTNEDESILFCHAFMPRDTTTEKEIMKHIYILTKRNTILLTMLNLIFVTKKGLEKCIGLEKSIS